MNISRKDKILILTGLLLAMFLSALEIKQQHYYLPLSGQKLFHHHLTERWWRNENTRKHLYKKR